MLPNLASPDNAQLKLALLGFQPTQVTLPRGQAHYHMAKTASYSKASLSRYGLARCTTSECQRHIGGTAFSSSSSWVSTPLAHVRTWHCRCPLCLTPCPCADIPWNYHETAFAEYDFESKQRNLARFVALAQDVGLYVLLRPSPYICAEWDFGGLPPRLVANNFLKVRRPKIRIVRMPVDRYACWWHVGC